MPGDQLRTLVASGAACLLLAASVLAQAPTAASQTVRGRILAEDTGQPLPNARVVIGGTSTAVRADLEGRFVIAASPAATLIVTKAGYVRTELPQAAATEVRLTRAAAIAGRVSDEHGEPLVGIFVTAGTADGPGATLRESARNTTDDHGEYRFGGLKPSSYTVSISVPAPQLQAGTPPRFPAFYYPDASTPAEARPVTLAAGDERLDIDFHLTAPRTAISDELPRVVGIRDMTIPSTGAATIRGLVRATDGRPLPYSHVMLYVDPGNNYREGISDENGRYEFANMPAGTYRVAAAKPGFSLKADGFVGYGALNLAQLGTPVTVADDDRRNGVDVTLVPWGAISGRIVDEAGEPVQGARVGLSVSAYEGGRRRLVLPARGNAGTTDDRGEFRIYGVRAGQYVVAAAVADTLAVDIGGFAQTFYPGTVVAAEARFVNVSAGEELGGIDIGLMRGSTTTLTGTLLDATGAPTSSGQFFLIPRSIMPTRIGARFAADGTFEFRNVTPGNYVVMFDQGRRSGHQEGAFVAMPITVPAAGVTGLRVQMNVGSRISGHVVFDSASGATPSPGAFSFSPIPADADLGPGSPAVGEPDANGRFELLGIAGARRLQLTKRPAEWALKSITLNGRDITDQVLEFGRDNQSLADVEVIVTDRINSVSGRAADTNGRVSAGTRVVAFTADRTRWYPGSRFIQTAVTTADGTYAIAGLPTGTYFVAAVARPPVGDGWWLDPAFLDSIRATATSVTLGDGQAQAVNLRVR